MRIRVVEGGLGGAGVAGKWSSFGVGAGMELTLFRSVPGEKGGFGYLVRARNSIDSWI